MECVTLFLKLPFEQGSLNLLFDAAPSGQCVIKFFDRWEERGRARRRKWLAVRSQSYAECPTNKVWILGRLADAATSHSGAFCLYVRSYCACRTLQRHSTNSLVTEQRVQASEWDTLPLEGFPTFCRGGIDGAQLHVLGET